MQFIFNTGLASQFMMGTIQTGQSVHNGYIQAGQLIKDGYNKLTGQFGLGPITSWFGCWSEMGNCQGAGQSEMGQSC